MGGVRWTPVRGRPSIEDRRFDALAEHEIADAVDGRRQGARMYPPKDTEPASLFEPELDAEPVDPSTPLTPDITDMRVLDGQGPGAPGAGGPPPPLVYETEEARVLLTVVQDYDREEEFVRLNMVRKWRKQLHYWNNYQYLAWDQTAHDWMTPDEVLEQDPQADINPAVYAKVINVYKAHGEILIGALTSGVPIARFFPKDADDQEDVSSAKAHTKLAEMVQKQNHSRLLLMKALFVLYNQGMVAAYNENKTDFRFGSLSVADYEDQEVVERQSYCPACGAEMGGGQFAQAEIPPDAPQLCPSCGETPEPGARFCNHCGAALGAMGGAAGGTGGPAGGGGAS